MSAYRQLKINLEVRGHPMTRKYDNFRVTTVYSFSDSATRKMENVLVDTDAKRLIYCTYDLPTPKSVSSTGVTCRIVEMPMKVAKDGIEIDHNMFIHKINNGHYKRADYNEICMQLAIKRPNEKRFNIFL